MNFKPTLKNPVNDQSKNYEKDFKKTMVTTAPNINLNEIDNILNEVDELKKKKIFDLDKARTLIFSDPKLLAIYNKMFNEGGREMWGYHYNEIIIAIIFHEYILSDTKNFQKYKMTVPQELKRRDTSGINQAKKSGMKKMTQSGLSKLEPTQPKKQEVVENEEPLTKVMFLVNEKDPNNSDLFAYFPEENYDNGGRLKTGYSHIGQHSAVSPQYADESRQATPEEYADLKTELENNGYNLAVINELQESTTAGSAGGAAGYVGYAGPAAWSTKGDLMGSNKKKGQKAHKPIWRGGTVIQESNYLTETNGFEKYIQELDEMLNEQSDVDFIPKHSQAYGTVNNMNPQDRNIIKKDIQNKKWDTNVNIRDSIALNEKAKSQQQQKFMGMVHAIQKGELNPDEVSTKMKKVAKDMNPEDVEDFAKTKHKGLPEKIDEKNNNIKEDTQTMIQNNGTSMSNKAQPTGDQSSNVPMGLQNTGGMNESDITLLEEINKELEAFSIHHNKLKLMAEDRKPSALVLRDRLGSENEKNFKKDFQDSDTKEVIDVEKELEWKDQQTDIGKDPQKLGNDIEKQEIKVTGAKGDEALKNVGDSANDSGDEIPKRNLTSAEQEEVNLYRQGLHSPVFDNEPNKRFEDRMKADMGEEIYDQRNKQIEFKGQAPMYNKEPQPVEDTKAKKVQFDKEQTGWNERVGIDNEKILKESMITGRYIDVLGKRRLFEFRLSEINEIEKIDENKHMKLYFDGLGNTYHSKTIDGKVVVNETVVNVMKSHKFYTDGKSVFSIKNVAQTLNESVNSEKKVIVNEQMDKMKHLLGYNPKSYVNTNNVKINRGF